MRKRTVYVRDKMQKRYRYAISAPKGRDFDPEFKPQLTPAHMLQLGVFCGKYMTDCRNEFPKSWFVKAKAGSIAMIRAAGSNGIAAITWAAACRRKTHGRSNAGRRFAATCDKSRRIANPAICCVARGNVRHCFTGLTTAGRFNVRLQVRLKL
jgi:hypothetical protein